MSRFAAILLSLAAGAISRAPDVRAEQSATVSLADFLLPERQEIALARSAAPDKVSGDATILVLGPAGYETAIEGSNGFVCLVIRSFGNPTYDHEYIYMPDIIVPECLDKNATQTILPMQKYRAELSVKMTPPADIEAAVKEGFRSGRFRRTESVSFSYMMSAAMTFGGGHHGPAHVMIYLPDDYSNDDIGGFPFSDRFVIVEGGPGQPFVAANIYIEDKAISPD